MPDGRTTATQRLLDRVGKGGAVAPGLWPLEVANVLLAAERRGEIAAGGRARALRYIAALPIAIDAETAAHAWSATFALAEHHGLSAYDAAYLELAQRRALPLASLDEDLRAAARTAGVELLGR